MKDIELNNEVLKAKELNPRITKSLQVKECLPTKSLMMPVNGMN